MKCCLKIFFIVVSLLNGLNLFSQDKFLDSLNSVLKTEKSDLGKINILNRLCQAYRNAGNNDTALYFGNEALKSVKIALKKVDNNSSSKKTIELKKELNNAFGNIGAVYYYQADFDKALYYFRNALSVARQLKDKNIIARRLGNMGNVYTSRSNYSLALNYYLRALKMDEELNNLDGVSTWLGNIGIIYEEQGNYKKALEYHLKSLEKSKELEKSPNKKLSDIGKNGKAVDLGNVGNVYFNIKDFSKALEYYFEALKTDEELNNQNGIARHLGNIGAVYEQMGNKNDISEYLRDSLFNNALKNYFLALEMQEKMQNKIGIATNLGNIGSIYTQLGKFIEAEQYLLKALKISENIGSQNSKMEFVELVAKLYEKKKEFSKAIGYYKVYYSIKDSLFNLEKNNELTRQEIKYEFEKKEARLKLKQEKKRAVALAEKKRQFIFLILVASVAFTVAIIAIIVFRSLRITKRQKSIIEEQKHLVDEKQQEIMASIHYAKRIQQALLPSEKFIAKNLTRFNKNT